MDMGMNMKMKMNINDNKKMDINMTQNRNLNRDANTRTKKRKKREGLISSLIISTLLLSSCAQIAPHSGNENLTNLPEGPNEDLQSQDTLSIFFSKNKDEKKKNDQAHGEKPHKDSLAQKSYTGLTHELLRKETLLSSRPDENMIRRVQSWIAFFTGRGKERFQRYLYRGAHYKNLIESILAEHDLPLELYYLAMIESGFSLRAHSSAGAVGPWQFMRHTGKRYALNVNSFVDERRDILKSTQAAAAHLRDLHNIFGTWELALSAYNAGTNRIIGVIIKGSHRDFWKLVELGILPRETKNYIPKFLAATMIGQNPKLFGFQRPSKSEEETKKIAGPYSFKNSDLKQVKGGVSLRKVAKILQTPLKQLKKLNPELRRNILPPTKKYTLRIPNKAQALYQEKLPELFNLKNLVARNGRYSQNGERRVYHIIKKGDTLSTIARKYDVSLKSLISINNLRLGRPLIPGKRLKVEKNFSGIYIVKRGDSLSRISQKFKLPVKQIKSINGLKTSRIYHGQRIRISAEDTHYYMVKKGDTLWDIAVAHNVSVDRLKRLNSLKGSRIFTGQKLYLARN